MKEKSNSFEGVLLLIQSDSINYDDVFLLSIYFLPTFYFYSLHFHINTPVFSTNYILKTVLSHVPLHLDLSILIIYKKHPSCSSIQIDTIR